MSIDLKTADHRNLDKFLDAVLDHYKNGEVSQSQAREALAQVFTAAAIDNGGEVKSWLDPQRVKDWKQACDDVNAND